MAKNKAPRAHRVDPKPEITRIDVGELQEARRDPRVRAFLKQAKQYGDRLDHEGRSR